MSWNITVTVTGGKPEITAHSGDLPEQINLSGHESTAHTGGEAVTHSSSVSVATSHRKPA